LTEEELIKARETIKDMHERLKLAKEGKLSPKDGFQKVDIEKFASLVQVLRQALLDKAIESRRKGEFILGTSKSTDSNS